MRVALLAAALAAASAHAQYQGPAVESCRAYAAKELKANGNQARDVVFERDRNLLEFLDARGIQPGAKLQLLARNYDQTLSIRTNAGAAVLGRPAAEKIWVKAAQQLV